MAQISSRCELQRVSVAFNTLNPLEKRLYDFICAQVNRSRFIKRLLERELAGDTSTGSIAVLNVSDMTEFPEGDETNLEGQFLD